MLDLFHYYKAWCSEPQILNKKKNSALYSTLQQVPSVSNRGIIEWMWRVGRWWMPININHISIYIQQGTTLQSLFISGKCSTCFGWYLHPSSGAHTTVSTVSSTCQTVIATCRYRARVVTGWQVPDTVDKVVCAPDDGWRYHPKYVEQFPDINKLCNVVSFWIYIEIFLRCTDHWKLQKLP